MKTPPADEIAEWVEGTEWSVKEADEFYRELRHEIERRNPDSPGQELDAHAHRSTRLTVKFKRSPSEIDEEKTSRRGIMDAKDSVATRWKVFCPSSDCRFSEEIETPTKHVFCPRCQERTVTNPVASNKESSGDVLEW